MEQSLKYCKVQSGFFFLGDLVTPTGDSRIIPKSWHDRGGVL